MQRNSTTVTLCGNKRDNSCKIDAEHSHLHYWSKIVIHHYDVGCLLRHLHECHIHTYVNMMPCCADCMNSMSTCRRFARPFTVKPRLWVHEIPCIFPVRIRILWTEHKSAYRARTCIQSTSLRTHGAIILPEFLSFPWRTPHPRASEQAHHWCHLQWLLPFEEWAHAIVEFLHSQRKVSATLHTSNQKWLEPSLKKKTVSWFDWVLVDVYMQTYVWMHVCLSTTLRISHFKTR